MAVASQRVFSFGRRKRIKISEIYRYVSTQATQLQLT